MWSVPLLSGTDAVEHSKTSPVTAGYVFAGVVFGAVQGFLRSIQRQTVDKDCPETDRTYCSIQVKNQTRKSLLNIVVVGTSGQKLSGEKSNAGDCHICGQEAPFCELELMEEVIHETPVTLAVWCVGTNEFSLLGCEFFECSSSFIILYDPCYHPIGILNHWSTLCNSGKKPFAVMACCNEDEAMGNNCWKNINVVEQWCQDHNDAPHFVRNGNNDMRTAHQAVVTAAQQVLAPTMQQMCSVGLCYE